MREVPREIELKLDIDPDDFGRLKRLSLMRSANGHDPRPRNLHSVYFDTEDRLLRAAGVELRIRYANRKRVQTLKASSAAAGLFERLEWEKPVESDMPDLSGQTEKPLRKLLGCNPAKLRLKPIFETRIRRRPLRIVQGGSEIEIALDEGEIANGLSSVDVHELELELKKGEPAELFRLAATLAESIEARLSTDSKAARGYALGTDGVPRAVKAVPAEISPGMESRAAFQAVARSCLTHLLVNEKALRATAAPDALHQMRVAVRRLRAAMSCFKPLVADDRSAALKGELKWFAGELAAARNLDVFLSSLLAPFRRDGQDLDGIEDLASCIQDRRDLAYPQALLAPRTPRYRRLVLDIAAWTETGAWADPGDDDARTRLALPVEALAARELHRRHKTFKRRPKIADLSPEERHELRIRAKKLRYAVEFFGRLFEGKKARKRCKAFASATVKLQEELGELNDIEEARALLAGIAGEAAGRPRRAFAAGLVAGQLIARTDEIVERASETCADLGRLKPFWT